MKIQLPWYKTTKEFSVANKKNEVEFFNFVFEIINFVVVIY